jgi:transcriptional regulator with XRE-family HTH domain
MKLFCTRLKEIRGGASQKAFATKLSLNQQTYQRYESGVREPDLETLHRIGVICKVSIDWLLGLKEDSASVATANGNGAIAVAGSNNAVNTDRDCSKCKLMQAHIREITGRTR